ncbi:Heterokaryon incompatibility protein (HET) domain containing protein [Rhypophila decipiens]
MRLINTSTLTLKEFLSPVPPYAILSHTWEGNETSYAEWQSLSFRGLGWPSSLARNHQGRQKIRKACKLARSEGYQYIWVDTCCIDKSSSAELTEAINSMFAWYQRAEVCYAYLSDLAPTDSTEGMAKCRWFGRGWTLQELIAPASVKFYDKTWACRGAKADLSDLIVQTTKIDAEVLRGTKGLEAFPVARKMGWASYRTTTREEDMAYCLLGIFDIHMPLIYGEGGTRAFIRLQEEIIKQTNDLSIFCWTTQLSSDTTTDPQQQVQSLDEFRGVLANSPSEFQYTAHQDFVSLFKQRYNIFRTLDFAITNKGIRINIKLSQSKESGLWFMPLSPLTYFTVGQQEKVEMVGIWLKRYFDGVFARARTREIALVPYSRLTDPHPPRYYLTKVILGRDMQKLARGSWLDTYRFHWKSDSPYYRYVSTSPSTDWQVEERALIWTRRRNCLVRHEFSTSWDNTTPDNRFLLVFGRFFSTDGDDKPFFCIWKKGSAMYDVVSQWSDDDFDDFQNLARLPEYVLAAVQPSQNTQVLELRRHVTEPWTPNASKGSAWEQIMILYIKVSIDWQPPISPNAGWQVDIRFDEKEPELRARPPTAVDKLQPA